jgi:hypothetical protein
MQKKIICIDRESSQRIINARRKAAVKKYNASAKGKAARKKWVPLDIKREWARITVQAARRRAKIKNREFNITVDYVCSIITDTCPIFNSALYYNKGAKDSMMHSPSLDRIDPSRGYTEDNLIVISHRANMLKSNATWQELQTIVDWIRKQDDDTKVHG